MPLKTRFAIAVAAAVLCGAAAQAADPSRLSPTDEPRGTTVVPMNPAHEAPAPTIKDLVVKHAHDNGVPVGLANAVINIESRFNPRARNHGAFGLMQINAGTARTAGFSGRAAGLFSPDTNLHFGMMILADAYRASGGDVCRTLAFYQSGHPVRHFSHAQRIYCAKARSFMAHA